MSSEYSLRNLNDKFITKVAIAIINNELDLLPISQARQILKEVDRLLEETMHVDCRNEEFRQACKDNRVFV
ncbi:TPA: hypothetical protein ACS55J_000722 [Salmonella enterica]